MSQPLAQGLSTVSPSRLRALRDCFLQVAFSQAAQGSADETDPQLIGEAAHETLSWLAKGGAPYDERLAGVSDDFTSRLAALSGSREVRGARPARARIRKVALRAVALLEEAGSNADVKSEQRLVSDDGLLLGIIDLAIASPLLRVVVDYKTGEALDESGRLSQHIEEQMAIYCILEQQRTGHWPQRALILRFGAAPVEWVVDPAVCEEVAAGALELRGRYDTHVGAVPPATPSPSACRFCSFAPRCDDFWRALSREWSDAVQGVRGTVKWAQRTSAGDITLALDDAEGAEADQAVIRQIPGDTLTDEDLEEGKRLAVVGLWTDRDGRWRAGRALRCSIDS